jgi:carboxylesterase type B
MQSGTSITPWAFQPNPQRESTLLGQRLGLSWTSTQDLVNQLRNIPFQTLVNNQGGWLDLNVPRGYEAFEFVPVVEPPNSPEYRFITEHPVTLMNRGDIMTVPLIIGYTSVESLFIIRESIIDSTVFDQFAANPFFYVHPSFNLHPTNNVAQVNEVATSMRNIYFQGGHPTPAGRFNYSEFMSEHHFTYRIDRTVRYHAKRQTQPIFYYKFDFDGSLNMIKRLLLLTDYPGAVHADVSK